MAEPEFGILEHAHEYSIRCAHNLSNSGAWIPLSLWPREPLKLVPHLEVLQFHSTVKCSVAMMQ